MPIGVDPGTDPTPPPGLPPSGGGGVVGAGGGSGGATPNVPGGVDGFGAPSPFAQPFRRPDTIRGIRGLGEHIPVVVRQRGINMNLPTPVPPPFPNPDFPGNQQGPMFDPSGDPVRFAPRTGRTPGGVGPGGVGVQGGNFPGFSGMGFPTGPMGPGVNDYAPGVKRRAGPLGYAMGGMAGGGMPGVDPGPPEASDTEPAMLTPGEMVMNGGVTSNPTIMAILTLLNILGAHHMEANSQGKPCPHCGQMDTDDGTPQGFGCGGKVGYATGGIAGWGMNLAGKGRFGPDLLGRSQPTNNPDGSFNWQRDSQGNVSNYNPADPWGSLRESRNPSTYGSGQRLLGQAGQQGVFDPRGNQLLLNQQLEAAQGTKDALVRRNMNAVDLSGLDPAQAAVARLQTLRDTGRGVQDISANIRADAAQRADDFYRQLFGNYTGADINYILNEQQGRQQRITNASGQKGASKGAWRDVLGNALGAAAGGFAGGGGAPSHP